MPVHPKATRPSLNLNYTFNPQPVDNTRSCGAADGEEVAGGGGGGGKTAGVCVCVYVNI